MNINLDHLMISKKEMRQMSLRAKYHDKLYLRTQKIRTPLWCTRCSIYIRLIKICISKQTSPTEINIENSLFINKFKTPTQNYFFWRLTMEFGIHKALKFYARYPLKFLFNYLYWLRYICGIHIQLTLVQLFDLPKNPGIIENDK